MPTREIVIIPLSTLMLCHGYAGYKIAEHLNANILPLPSAPALDWCRLVPMISTSEMVVVLFTAFLYVMHRRVVATRALPLSQNVLEKRMPRAEGRPLRRLLPQRPQVGRADQQGRPVRDLLKHTLNKE